tara:strand:+ start:272 stop:1639 length:1368 start_codon:yes stop_codon:yes gene_type:complete
MSEIKVNSTGEVKLFDSDNSNYVSIKSPATVSSNQTFVLPDADGSANNALKTDGSGNLGFVDVTTLVTQGLDWQSTIKTSNFTAVSGEAYFCNTSGGAFTATLPASPSAGAIVAFKDYAPSFATNNLTIGRNSSNIQGNATDSVLSTNRSSVVLVYVDSTKGWLYVQESNVQQLGPLYVTGSGGTVTTSGDFKIHTFTSSGTFTVSCAGNTKGSTTVDYVVVAGGGSGGGTPCGGNQRGGGGGAGGYRESFPNPATGGFPVSAQAYPITVGGGGTVSGVVASNGSNSIFSTITSAGGGKGAHQESPSPGAAGSGGSGGGGSSSNTSGGTGNTPPVSPSQGNNGGVGTGYHGKGGGGGGAGEAGNTDGDGDGGDGVASTISGSSVTRAGGGAGAANPPSQPTPSAGTGGGGAGGGGTGTAGTANTGGGGGGGYGAPAVTGGTGGSGVVIIRYKYQN